MKELIFCTDMDILLVDPDSVLLQGVDGLHPCFVIPRKKLRMRKDGGFTLSKDGEKWIITDKNVSPNLITRQISIGHINMEYWHVIDKKPKIRSFFNPL